MMFDILNRTGRKVGCLSYGIHPDERSLGPSLFGNLEIQLDFFLNQIPREHHEFPMAVLDNISVYNKRRGHGRRAIQAFHCHLKEKGVNVVFIRVSAQGDELELGLKWRRKFYESEGYVCLHSGGTKVSWYFWMYRTMDQSTHPDRPTAMILREASEVTDNVEVFDVDT